MYLLSKLKDIIPVSYTHLCYPVSLISIPVYLRKLNYCSFLNSFGKIMIKTCSLSFCICKNHFAGRFTVRCSCLLYTSIFEEYPDTVHMHCSPCMICRDKDIIFFLFQFYKTKALMITDKSSFFDQSQLCLLYTSLPEFPYWQVQCPFLLGSPRSSGESQAFPRLQ